MMNLRRMTLLSALAMGLMVSGAWADDQMAKDQSAKEDSNWVTIKAWTYDASYLGWSADELLDEEVYGRNGEEIGEVEDIIVGPDGQIKKVIVEGGGFLDIGDTHVGVPWKNVTRSGSEFISVPISEDNLGTYRLFENEDFKAAAKNFRVRELMGDFVSADGKGYGYIRDIIFSQEGKIESLIVNPAYGYGYGRTPVAFPYFYGYNPASPYYDVPYSVQELKDLKPFRYDKLKG